MTEKLRELLPNTNKKVTDRAFTRMTTVRISFQQAALACISTSKRHSLATCATLAP